MSRRVYTPDSNDDSDSDDSVYSESENEQPKRSRKRELVRSRSMRGKNNRGSKQRSYGKSRNKHGKREGNAFRYTGGKAAIASDIHDVIVDYEDRLVGKEQSYLEPFCGAMSVAFKFALDIADGKSDREIIVSDYNNDMVRFWKALKAGKKPPKYVSEREYEKYKNGSLDMKGYVGSVFSFGGAMFGAYRGRYQSVEKTKKEGMGSYNKLMKVVPLMDYITIKSSRSYDEWSPSHMTVYCDPPYETESEKSNPNEFLRDFDHEEFWDVMREWSKNNLVFISELKANVPKDFRIIWQKTIKRSFRSRSDRKEKKEILCIHKSWLT